LVLLLLWSGHAFTSSAPAPARSRKESTLWIGISLRAGQTVTTVWRTEPGTTLVSGFNSTTVFSAYFRYPGSYQFASRRTIAPVRPA